MPFTDIGNITIGNNSPGEAYGTTDNPGYIYSANISIGNSSSPTKLTINIVHKKGIQENIKNSIKEDINELNKISINVGDLPTMTFYLISYQIRKSVGSNTLTLEYADGSILLDKIQVCLTERQYAKENQNTLYPFSSGSIKDFEAEFELTAKCLKCDHSGELENKTSGKNGAKKLHRTIKYASDESKGTNSTSGSPPFFYVPSNPDHLIREGGLLVLGRENFVENNCDVPEVDYTFSDLIAALSSEYITIKDQSLKDRTIDSEKYSSFRKNYSGTLREVLNSWCSDFGFSFTWNIFNSDGPQIVGIDLTQSVGSSNIRDIKNLIDSVKGDDARDNNTVVESSTESYSKEGTYKQSYISQYIKGAKTKTKNSTRYAEKLFYNVPIELITTDGIAYGPAESSSGKAYTSREWAGRTLNDFVTSCCIGKFNREARTSFLYRRALGKDVGTGTTVAAVGAANAMGYLSWGAKLTGPIEWQDANGTWITPTRLESYYRNQIIAEWPEDKIIDTISKFGEDFTVRFCIFSEEEKRRWEDWDISVAEGFLGRFYFKPILDGELDEKGVVTKAAFENMTRMVGDGEVKAYPFRKHFENQDASNFPWAKFIQAGESHRLHKIFPFLREREYYNNAQEKYMSQQGIPEEFIDPLTGDIKSIYTANGENNEHYKSDNAKYENGVWAFERDAKWGTTQAECDAFFSQKLPEFSGKSSATEIRVPENIPLSGRSLMIYQEMTSKRPGATLAEIESEQYLNMVTPDDYAYPVLVVGPPAAKALTTSSKFYGDGISGFLKPKSITDMTVARRYFSQTAPNFNETVSQSISAIGEGGENVTSTNDKSSTLCEVSALEELCGICGLNDELNKPYVGFPYFGYTQKYTDPITGEDLIIPRGTICEAFSIPQFSYTKTFGYNKDGYRKGVNFYNSSVFYLKIVLPCQLDYRGYLETNYNSRQTIEGVSKVFGHPLPLEKLKNGTIQRTNKYKNSTLGIKLIENNITSDVDSSMYDVNDDQERILNIFVPNGLTAFKDVTAESYHNEIKKYFDDNLLGVDLPREQYSFSLAGLNFSNVKGGGTLSLQDLIKPEKGWASMSISYDEKGITTNLVFQTRPSVLANPQIYMKHLGPKMNTFGRG